MNFRLILCGWSLLGFATVVVQQAAVSQISIFGVSADLGPLVVMSVGLLAGSLAGRDHRLWRRGCSSTSCSSRRSA